MLGEEFRRSEFLETKSRHLATACGALFAVTMATTAGVLNALFDRGEVHSWPYVIGGLALVSLLALIVALIWTQQVQKLHETDALEPKTIKQYIAYAEKGNVGVAKHLITSYADFLQSRRDANEERVTDLKRAAVACTFSAIASVSQLGAAFLAVIKL
jgi:hypothetical protein